MIEHWTIKLVPAPSASQAPYYYVTSPGHSVRFDGPRNLPEAFRPKNGRTVFAVWQPLTPRVKNIIANAFPTATFHDGMRHVFIDDTDFALIKLAAS